MLYKILNGPLEIILAKIIDQTLRKEYEVFHQVSLQ